MRAMAIAPQEPRQHQRGAGKQQPDTYARQASSGDQRARPVRAGPSA